MLWEIAKNEILQNIKSQKFILSFLLCTFLVLLSVYFGANNYREEVEQYNEAIVLNRNNLETNKSYGAIGLYGITITKSPEVLGTIATGIKDAVGRQANIDVRTIPSLSDSRYGGSSLSALFGELDLTLIVKIVLSLFAILFTYNAVSGEKELGTLRLAISNNIPRSILILGKVIGSFISLLLPLVVSFLLGFLILVIYPGFMFSGEDWIRIGLIFVLFILYLSAFITLGVFISTLTRHSSNSLFILLFLWVVFVMVIPKASVMISGQLEPIPSMHEITAQKDAFREELSKHQLRRMKEWREKSNGLGKEERRKSLGKFYQDIEDELNTMKEAKYSELDEGYRNKRRSQQILAMTLSRISPASALTFSAASMGRTGIEEHEHFERSVKAYKPLFLKWKNEKEGPGGKGNLEEPDISDMPKFEFKPESLRDSVARALPDFLILILMSVVFFAGAFVSFLRYDVR